MCLDDLLDRPCSWLSSDGPCSDVVVSSRLRFARNVSGFPFIGHLDEPDALRLVVQIRRALAESLPEGSYEYFSADQLEEEDVNFLIERRLVGDRFLKEMKEGGLAIESAEEFSVSVLEEDHLRIQLTGGGLCLSELWKKGNELDDLLSERLNFSFDDRFGYLTRDPGNVGTGLRASAIVHLPGMIESREIVRAFRAFERMNYEIKGISDSQGKPIGDLFQVGNRTTLGQTEEEIVNSMNEAISSVVEYERLAREKIVEADREGFTDRCYRSLGVLKSARLVSYEDARRCLSAIRLGVHMNLFNGIDERDVNRLFQGVAPHHVRRQASLNGMFDADEDACRAEYLRAELKKVD